MTAKKTPFQMIVFGVFAFFVIAAVLVFATFSSGGGGNRIKPVTIWGTLDQTVMNKYLSALADTNAQAKSITYKQIPASSFQTTLNAALANGNGPDLIMINQSGVVIDSAKMVTLPFSVMSKRTFTNTFVDEAQMFLGNGGIRALPFSIDPMVLYWNRDMFAEAGFASPPKFWDQLFAMAEKITKRDNANNINRSTIALGEFDNINHAKDIIALLIMQAGGKIVTIGSKGYLQSNLIPYSNSSTSNPTDTALRFYTDFSNPIKNVYTWNRSLPMSLNAFAQGKLALYLGYASELKTIKDKNDNLNFDIAPVPQIRSGSNTRVITFGTLYGIAVLRASRNQGSAEKAAELLSSVSASKLYTKETGIPSPHRSLLGRTPNNSLKSIFRTAALLSTAWFDPSPNKTTTIFRQMVVDITSGTSQINSAVLRANQELTILLKP